MKDDDVPQDAIDTYGGHRKLFYAQRADGDYVGVTSSGWEVEQAATHSALALIEQQKRTALDAVRSGRASPLLYYMYYRRMDVPLLAQATGLWRWRVRRHFRPGVYARLPERVLARYSEALGLSPATLRTLHESPDA